MVLTWLLYGRTDFDVVESFWTVDNLSLPLAVMAIPNALASSRHRIMGVVISIVSTIER